ncbi:MAG TPA: glutathionylspermidine synthase family protein, partial [Caulobacteraceae bacterium]
SLLEAAAVQWWWMEQRFPLADQFNGVHDALIGALKAWRRGAPSNVLHFTCVTPHAEDEGTVTYLAACAGEAGLTPVFVPLEEIGLTDDGFVDGQDRPIEAMFKLVPWEWMLADPFGERLAAEVLAGRLRLVEPAWKMLASHKRLLVTLKALFPDSPLLLDATDDVAVARGWGDYVRKPVHGREGANVALYTGGQKDASQDGTFEDDEVIYQRRAALAQADGAYAVLGGWIVDGEACGLGIRESRGPITTNTARFVPHVMAEPGEVGG